MSARTKKGLLVILVIILITSAGCVSMAKKMIGPKDRPIPVMINDSPVSDEIQKKPELKNFYSIDPRDIDISRAGIHKLGEFYTWRRENVSGLKDMTVYVTVYRYKFLDGYTWHNDADNKFYWQSPGSYDLKFLFIFAQIFMAGNDPSQDPRYYIGDPWKRFYVQWDNTTASPDTDYVKSVQIQELEDVFNLNDDNRVQPFGYRWEYTQVAGNISDGGWKAITPEWLRMGRSNAWDGYVLFQVPKNLTAQDIRILSQWDTFGSPWWILEQ